MYYINHNPFAGLIEILNANFFSIIISCVPLASYSPNLYFIFKYARPLILYSDKHY
jgi:hypothetical protein